MLMLPEPSPGLDWRVLGDPTAQGMWKSWQVPGRAVMDEGKSPPGQEEGTGLCFTTGEPQEARSGLGDWGCAGLPPTSAGTPGGPGVPFPSQEGVCSGRLSQPLGCELAEKQVGALCSAEIVPAPCPIWDKGRRTGIGALGEHPGEQALVLQHQGRRQNLRP